MVEYGRKNRDSGEVKVACGWTYVVEVAKLRYNEFYSVLA